MWEPLAAFLRRLLGRQATEPPVRPPLAAQPQRDSWELQQAEQRAARESRRQPRRTRDRRAFGEETWGVSARQRHASTDVAKLQRFGLPVLRTEHELAAWLAIPLTRLRWFTHDKAADTVWHYIPYSLPKRRGGVRLILAPKRALKTLQRKVWHDLLKHIPVGEGVHGFVPGRSIASNARQHVGRAVVLRLDLKDFFPSITYPRVRGIFLALGYAFPVASTLALLCTTHTREPFTRDGQRYFISVEPRCLPQGAPTSPALANAAAWRLDRRLTGLARAHHFIYTRYADDLTFSGDNAATVQRLLHLARRIITDEHFTLHPEKTRLARHSARQMVTGLVVNDALGTPRHRRRQLRAILHNAQRSTLETQNRQAHRHFRAYLSGWIGHIAAANPRHAAPLQALLRVLRRL